MSRFEVNTPAYQFVYGVDHVTGTFIQVHDNLTDEDDTLIVRIDNQGVSRYKDTDTVVQANVLDTLELRFTLARSRNNPYPNLGDDDILQVAKAFDVPLSSATIYTNINELI